MEPYSLGDPNAGVHAPVALLPALEHRRRTGNGMLVEAAPDITAEQVIEYPAYGVLLERAGNRGPATAPQNLYRAAGIDEFGREDCWVAVAVVTDDHWRRLREALGRPERATDPRLDTDTGRRRRHEYINEHVAAWCGERDADEIVHLLRDVGVPVGKVMQPHRQTDIPQLEFRGFFEPADHRSTPRLGTARYPCGCRPVLSATIGATRHCPARTTAHCLPGSGSPMRRSPHSKRVG